MESGKFQKYAIQYDIIAEQRIDLNIVKFAEAKLR